jgi:hypothetical protein
MIPVSLFDRGQRRLTGHVRNGGSGIYDAAIEEHPPARGLAAVVH